MKLIWRRKEENQLGRKYVYTEKGVESIKVIQWNQCRGDLSSRRCRDRRRRSCRKRCRLRTERTRTRIRHRWRWQIARRDWRRNWTVASPTVHRLWFSPWFPYSKKFTAFLRRIALWMAVLGSWDWRIVTGTPSYLGLSTYCVTTLSFHMFRLHLLALKS